MRLVVLLVLFGGASARFQCYTCNNREGDDDSTPCVDEVENCEESIDSCSVVTYRSVHDNALHVRKFCTGAGTPIYKYLLFFPGSSLCQNIQTKNDNFVSSEFDDDEQELLRRRRRDVGPPAPPHEQTSSLLCVCTSSLCNGGSYREVIRETLTQRLEEPVEGLAPPVPIAPPTGARRAPDSPPRALNDIDSSFFNRRGG